MPPGQSLLGDVPAVVHPIEMNLVDGRIGVRRCRCQIRTGRSHA